MKKLLPLILFGTLVNIFPQVVTSQTIRQPEVTTNSKPKVKAATTSAQPKEGSSTISFIQGTVSALNTGSYVINTQDGSRIIYTSEVTKFINIDDGGKKLIGFGDIKVGDQIIILGVSSYANSGSARFVVRDQLKSISSFSMLGKVSSTNDNSILIEDLLRSTLPKLTINTDSTTTMLSSNKKQLTLTDLSASSKIVVTGIIDDKGKLLTKSLLKLEN